MANKVINVGTNANSRDGDPIRTAFQKVNENFTELYAAVELGVGQPGADGASAYEIAVDNGFVGTEATWLTSLQGVNGTNGAQGDIGPAGAQGDTGSQGPVGPSGAQGDTGPQGATGPAGSIGPTGAQGVKGDTGATGPEGATGAAGVAGATGATGPKGDKGDQGVAGSSGAQGAPGAKGDTGNTGAQGVSVTLQGTKALIADLPLTGNAGDGWIVTEGGGDLWFWNLTEGAWNNIGPIVGPQGDQGAQGPAGSEGAQGAQGVAGNDGAPGATGATGPQGNPGPVGSQGPAGDPGAVGPEGPAGAAGPQGDQGAQGPTGATGPQGDTGPQGPTGDQGPTGPAGADGADGADGAQGPQGDPGPAGDNGAPGDDGADGVDALWNWQGAYDAGPQYQEGDIVSYQGSTYRRNNYSNSAMGFAPTDTLYWQVVAEKGGDSTPTTVLAHLELVDRTTTIGNPFTFTKLPNTDTQDNIDTGLSLTRLRGEVAGGGGLINIAQETVWNQLSSPAGTKWNWDGWNNLDTVRTRNYDSFRQTLKHNIGANVVNAELVMHDIINDKYYKIKFTSWARGSSWTGGFAYTRQLIDTESKVGIEFADGTKLATRPKEYVDLPQIFSGDVNQYILGLGDRGKHVYVFTESEIKIPTAAEVNFPAGSTFVIVTGEITGPQGVRVTCTAPMSIEREGVSGLTSVLLKPYSTLILIKITENTWNLSGAQVISDQSLNTTDSVVFDSLSVNGVVEAQDHLTITSTDVDALEEAYLEQVALLEDQFAQGIGGAPYTGVGTPASKLSYAALIRAKATNPLIPDAWLPIANSLRNAYFSWAAASITLTPTDSGFTLLNGGGVGLRYEEATGLRFPDNTFQTTAFTGEVPDIGDITFTDDEIGSTTNVVNINASEYAQLQSGENYIYVDNTGVNIELDYGEATNTWSFENRGALRLPAGGDIIDSNGQSVLGGGSGVPGLTGDTSYTPDSEGDTNYSLDINGDIVLRTYDTGSGENLGPGISLGANQAGGLSSGVIAIGNNDTGLRGKKGGVYIGYEAGWNDSEQPQGEYAIAIGAKAARNIALDNSITLNATGVALDPDESGLFIKPIREEAYDDVILYYNPTSGEVTYAVNTGGGSSTVAQQDTAPTAVDGTLWYNTLEGRLYIKYGDAWVDAAPLMMPQPETELDVNSITFPDATVQTSAFANKLVNGVHEVVLGANGTLTVADDIILPKTGRIIKDCDSNGGTTSMRWINIPTDQEVQLLRAYTGDPLDGSNNDVERVKVSLEWQTATQSGLSISAFNDGDEYKWDFRGDGAVAFPYQSTNDRTGSADALVFAKTSNQKAIATQSGTADSPTVERLVIAGGDSYYDANANEWFGEGGDLYLWAGKGGGGGDIKVDAGNALGLNNDSGGTIKIRGGQSQSGTGGFIEITAGYSVNQNGGSVAITGGEGQLTGGDVTIAGGYGTTTHGKIRLSTAGRTKNWDFGIDGSLTLPSGAGFGLGESGQLKVNDSSTASLDFRDTSGRGFYTNSDGYTLRSNGTYNWKFGTDGALTFPGSVVNSTVAKTGATIPTTTGTLDALAHDSVLTGLTDAQYGPFTLGTVTFSVAVSGGVVNNIVSATSTAPVTIGDVVGTINSGDIGGTAGTTITITVDAVVQATPTAVDLTKTVNKLTDGDYTLADGVEGQIMYLVRQTGAAYNAIMINVANARVDGALTTTIDYYPFETSLNMSTLIFTDGAWQASNGGWD